MNFIHLPGHKNFPLPVRIGCLFFVNALYTCVVVSWMAHCFPPPGDLQTQKNQFTLVEQVNVTV